ncbi:MAG: hypothetical protein LUG83_07090 [Lachnospiraceae bacterium]|nr:hypothetical protein [Lachnospiraceae bacterium]
MNSAYTKIYNFALGFIRILSVIFSGMLFVSAFFSTCYSLDMTSQEVLTRLDRPVISITGMAAMGAVMLIIVSFFSRGSEKRIKIFIIMAIIWCLIAGAALILFSKTVPAADAMSVYSIAESLAANDTSVIHPTESYLSYYPQQVGLVAFFEILIRLWKLLPTSLPAYHMIKCLYVALACICLILGYLIVHMLWNDKRKELCFIALSVFNFPFIMYTSFVYGEIPSYTALLAGIYFLLRLLHASSRRSILYALSGLLFFTLSVLLRKNSLIVIIAVVIVALLQAVRDKRAILAAFACLCAVLSVTILPLTEKYYEYRSGSEIGSGVTAMAYFAMGMQESSRGNGWYNGFNFETYQISGMNTETANEISLSAISERLEYFKENPTYALSFYLHKYLSQWADGTYASRQATLATFGGRRPFWDNIYSGKYSAAYIEYCNIYQNILYLGALIFFAAELRRHCAAKKAPEDSTCKNLSELSLYINLIAVFGGFLFHMVWEANSRYIFVYGMLLLPYSASGLAELFSLSDRLKGGSSL